MGPPPPYQPPVRGPQGLDEGVEGIVLPPVPAELGVQPVESVVSLPGLTLHSCRRRTKQEKTGVRGNANAERSKGEKTAKPGEKSQTQKMRHAGPPWISNASFSAPLSEVPWSRNSCHSAYSA
jgi:hypothetical protein